MSQAFHCMNRMISNQSLSLETKDMEVFWNCISSLLEDHFYEGKPTSFLSEYILQDSAKLLGHVILIGKRTMLTTAMKCKHEKHIKTYQQLIQAQEANKKDSTAREAGPNLEIRDLLNENITATTRRVLCCLKLRDFPLQTTLLKTTQRIYHTSDYVNDYYLQ